MQFLCYFLHVFFLTSIRQKERRKTFSSLFNFPLQIENVLWQVFLLPFLPIESCTKIEMKNSVDGKSKERLGGNVWEAVQRAYRHPLIIYVLFSSKYPRFAKNSAWSSGQAWLKKNKMLFEMVWAIKGNGNEMHHDYSGLEENST